MTLRVPGLPAELPSELPEALPETLSPAAVALGERFDALEVGIFQRKGSNFTGLVLLCIETDVCKQELIF